MNEEEIKKKFKDLIKQMTLKEKVAQLCSVQPEKILDDEGVFSSDKASEILKDGMGQITRIAGGSNLKPRQAAETANAVQKFLEEKTRLGIPAIFHEECLSGFMTKGGTTYPQSIGMASSWEPELIEEITNEIRKQLSFVGAHLALSPVLDLACDPRWGRVEESYGEDPYLAAEMAHHYIKGLYGSEDTKHIYGTLKHFAGHGASEGGKNHAPVNISERALRELHLFPFEAVIKSNNVESIMNAYHDIDGIPCACSLWLLTDILRREWGFQGIVVSDYQSINMLHTIHHIAEDEQDAGIKALKAGMDIELPEIRCYGEELVKACENGLIKEEYIDRAVGRHLRLKFKMGLFKERYVKLDQVNSVFETKKQRLLARRAARKSMVLLKNDNSLLPLSKDIRSIAVIGPNADSRRNLLGDYAYGALVENQEGIEIVSILEGIKAKVGSDTEIHYTRGCGIFGEDLSDISEAIKIAEKCEAAVVVVGGKSGIPEKNTSGERHDRANLNLPGKQLELIKKIKEVNNAVVVVLVNGRPLSVNWINENIPAVLEAWLPGEEGGHAACDLLFGDFNPGGKLPVSIPRKPGQIPVNYNRKPVSYQQPYVFTSNKPLYPFGYGLSYTSFTYSNLKIRPQNIEHSGNIEIRFTVENTGETTGDEISQLYIRDEAASVTRPIKELKGFKRFFLKPGEKRTLRFKVAVEQLAFYDQNMKLVVEPGTFKVMIGSSSEDIHLTGKFIVQGKRKNKINSNRTFFTEVTINDDH